MRILAGTLTNRTRNLNHEFTAQFIRLFAKSCINLLIKYQLSNTITVADIDKCHSSHFAGFLHPTGQCNHQTFIRKAQVATSSCSIHLYYLIC